MSGVGYSPMAHWPWWAGPAGAALVVDQAAWPGLLLLGGAALASAAAIRLMDEYLDKYGDELAGRLTVTRYLGDGALPYALLAFCLAVLLAPAPAVVLFLAAYAVGMAGEWRQRLPTGWPGGLEAAAVLLVGAAGVGITGMAWGFCFMSSLQCLDDVCDQASDARAGQRNLCRRWGSGETLMIGIFMAVCALRLSPALTLIAALAALLSYAAWPALARHLAHRSRFPPEGSQMEE